VHYCIICSVYNNLRKLIFILKQLNSLNLSRVRDLRIEFKEILKNLQEKSRPNRKEAVWLSSTDNSNQNSQSTYRVQVEKYVIFEYFVSMPKF